jgi:hypothetical protein
MVNECLTTAIFAGALLPQGRSCLPEIPAKALK